MSNSQTRRTAGALLIDTQGRFLFQQRDDIPTIIYPGKVGLFGGHLENDESFLQCVCREVHEEISYHLSEDAFQQLGWYKSAHSDGKNIVAGIFLAREIPANALMITEGSLLIVARDDVHALRGEMTPSALTALELFIGRG